MTLTTRLSLFFLATLALVLAGFSTTLYFLASGHLHAQAEERLEASLNTLAAAADVGPEGVEWESAGRHLSLGPAAFGDAVVWWVSDDRGQIVDQSKQGMPEAWQALRSSQQSAKWVAERWLFREKWIGAPNDLIPSSPRSQGGDEVPPPARDKNEQTYRELAITAGTSLDPVHAILDQLAWVLFGLSLGIWLLAQIACRFVCRRALLPVRRMAATARAMDVNDPDERLPPIASGDELEDFSRAFNGVLDRLQESFERQRQFTGDASHQLRTPLTAILGQIEIALRRDRPAEEYRQTITTVQQQAERLRRIVDALLFLARADAEGRVPDCQRLDLRTWLPAHVKSWSGDPRAGDIVLKAEEIGPASVEAHPDLLGELVNILFDNACKYSPAGKPITLGLKRAGDFIELFVRDEGYGIADEHMPHIFRPFFRSPETRRRGVEGLGLGLAIAKRIADAFGGTLTVTSQAGQGSCFTLQLPAH